MSYADKIRYELNKLDKPMKKTDFKRMLCKKYGWDENNEIFNMVFKYICDN